MKRVLAVALAVLAWAAVGFVQSAVTDLAGRGGTGGCPAFAGPPGGGVFFLDPLTGPGGVAVALNGKLFVSTSSNCVWRLDADGLLRTGFLDSAPFRIGTGSGGFSDNAPSFDAGGALLSNPQNLALDSEGNLYIADASNQRIRKVNTATWTISTIAGGGSLRPTDGIHATDASFLFPVGVAVDHAGNVYVSDSNAQKVFKVDTGGILTRFAGSGASTYNGENIPATSAAMIPMGLAVDAADDVFIADWSNSIVRKVTPDGNITTVAGNPFNVTALGDGGPAFGATLARPRGVAVDAVGNLFIADTEHHRIRMVDALGIITTIAGNGIAGSGDGQLSFPTAVAADNLGNVFIADTGNNKLRGIIVTQRTYRLTLTATGDGTGTMTGAGSYIVGEFVPLTATAAAGSAFTGWTGPNAAECAAGFVLIDADKSCVATFMAAPDTTPPVLSGVPTSFTVNTPAAGGTVVSYVLPTAIDPDDAAGPVICAPPSGSVFPVGATTVTCSSTDTHGNVGTASFIVTVVNVSASISIEIAEPIAVAENANPDTPLVRLPLPIVVNEPILLFDGYAAAADITPPVFSGVPSTVTVPATSVNGVPVTYSLPTASDPDDLAGPVTCAPASGTLFGIGVTTVTCTSTDSHGNTGSTSFTVTVTVVAPVASIVANEVISVADNGGAVSTPTPIVVMEPISVNENPVLPPAVALVVQEPISVADTSSATVPDTTPLGVTVLAPASGERLFLNTPTAIRWLSTGHPTSFDVQVSNGATDPFHRIPACANLPGTATSCRWTPTVLAPRGDARILVTARGAAGDASAVGGPFTVVAGTPALRVTSPNTAVHWAIGTQQTITWTDNLGIGATSKVELSRNGGQTWETLAASLQNSSPTSGQLAWEVTGLATTNALVRVTWLDGAASDVSNVPFAIEAPRITVTAPNGGENWVPGTTHNITWTHNLGTAASVSIDLSRDGGSTWESIASSVANAGATAGQFNWLVTSPVTSRALVRVGWLHRSQALGGLVSDRSDAFFTIASRITVTSPNTAVTWAAGSLRQIWWSHNYGASQLFDIDVSTDGGATWTPAAQNVPVSSATSGTADVRMPAVVTTQALVRVSPAGNPGDGDVSDVPFSLVAPTLVVTAPAAGAAWMINTSRTIRWITNVGPISGGYTGAVSYDGGTTWTVFPLSDISFNHFSGTWFVHGPATTHARIRVTWSGGGLSVSDESPEFTIASRIR